MAARINETTASHYSAAIWSMVHGLAMLLLKPTIPPEWMQDDFKLAIELVVRPWINGLADMPTPVLSQMVNCSASAHDGCATAGTGRPCPPGRLSRHAYRPTPGDVGLCSSACVCGRG
ncbi:MAG: hypothetical protein U1E47_00095 [Rivihabitans pingtungensis]